MSGHRSIKQVAVLDDRSGQVREVHLAVIVDVDDDAQDGVSLRVAGEQHGAGADALTRRCVREGGPSEPVVVLVVGLSDESVEFVAELSRRRSDLVGG